MIIHEVEDKIEYEQIWKKAHGHILQSWEWGEIKGGAIRLVIDTGKYQTPISVLVRKTPILRSKYGYIPRWSTQYENPSELTEMMCKYLKENYKLKFILIELNYPKDYLTLPKDMFTYAKGHVQPEWTNIVNIANGKEAVLAAMKGNYRRNIKKAERDGVQVFRYEADDYAVNTFIEVMKSIAKQTKYITMSPEYFKKVWKVLSDAKKAEIFIATYNLKSVGAYFVTYDELGAYEFYGGVTPQGREVEAGYLVKWKAMERAIELGKSFYDHWGVARRLSAGSYDPKSELFAISRFKEGFGGKDIEFEPMVAYGWKGRTYKIFRVLDKMRKVLLKIKKLFRRQH